MNLDVLVFGIVGGLIGTVLAQLVIRFRRRDK